MIILFTGRPGSGKTYRAVEALLSDKHTGKYFIFHNIDSLKESLIEDGTFIKNFTTIPDFLTFAKQQEISEWVKSQYSRSMLIIIDEAQDYFQKRTQDHQKWLSWHRHMGQDIWLITQNKERLDKDYIHLAEYECRAKRGIATKQFIYQFSVGGEVFKTDRIPIKRSVFAAYKSFQVAEQERKRIPLFYYAAALLVVALSSVVYLIAYGIPGTFGKDDVAHASIDKNRMNKLPKKLPVGKNKSSSSTKIEPPKPTGKFHDYSYAGVVGGRVLLQNTNDGRIVPLEEVQENYVLLKADGHRVMFGFDKSKIANITRNPDRSLL